MFRFIALLLAIIGFTAAHAQGYSVPQTLYIIGAVGEGTVNKYDFDGIEFSREGDVFKCHDVTLHASNGNMAEFAITSYNGSDRWKYNSSYVTASKGSENIDKRIWTFTESNQTYTRQMQQESQGITMTITPGTYDFLMDFSVNLPTLTETKAGGVSTSVAKVATTEPGTKYYTLQGQVVERPIAGLYIAKSQSNVRLVVIK